MAGYAALLKTLSDKVGNITSTASNYLSARREAKNRQPFQKTPYGQELGRIIKEGMYSPKARGLITGSVARRTGEVAQTGKANYLGRLVQQGMGGSIAGQRGINEYDIQRQKQIADTAREIELQNEESKARGRLSYAEAATKDAQERQALENAKAKYLTDLAFQTVSSGGEVAGQYLDSKQSQTAQADKKQADIQFYASMSDEDFDKVAKYIPDDVLLEILQYR